MIDTYDYTLKNLIVDKNYLFVVPNYQRSYVWTEKEIYQFLKDGYFCLKKFVNSRNKFEHYAGQMIFRSLTKWRDGRELLEIIDGQQRLTTFMILVAASVDVLKAQDVRSVIAEELKQKYLFSSSDVCREMGRERVSLSRKDISFWNKLINGILADTEKIDAELESQKRIWDAYCLIKRYLKTITAECSECERENVIKSYIDALTESFRIVVLMTEDPGHEFALFQIVNDRGLPLTPGEMLKARTIELFSNQKLEDRTEYRKKRLVNAAEEIWENILLDSGKTTVEYLTWSYIAILGKKPDPFEKLSLNEQYEKDIFQCLNQREISMDAQDTMLETLVQLQEHIEMCRFLIKGEFPIKGASSNLKLLLGIMIRNMKNIRCIPLYLKLLYNNKEKTALRIAEQLTPMLLKVHFMTKIMGTLNDESIINCYLKIWKAFDEQNFDIDKVKADLEDLLKKRKCKTEFHTKINQAVYVRGDSNGNAKFLLLMAELQCLKEKKINFGDDSVDMVFDKMSVEHILCEGVNEDSVSRNFYESIHKIGNLTLLGRDLNSLLKDKAFEDKIKWYRESPYYITREVGRLSDWNYIDYSKRQEEMVSILKSAFEL